MESGKLIFEGAFSDIGTSKEDYATMYTAVAYASYLQNGKAVTEYSMPISTSYYSECKKLDGSSPELYTETVAEVITMCESASINSLSGAFSANVSGFDGMVNGYSNNYIFTDTAVVETVNAAKQEFRPWWKVRGTCRWIRSKRI